MDVVHTSVYQNTDTELGGNTRLRGLLEDLSEDQRYMLKDLTGRYSDVYTDIPGETDVIQHRENLTDDTPIHCKLYPLMYAMREELQNEVDSMLEMGVVRPSSSPYTLPIIMVKKKHGSNRVYVDLRKLNKITNVDPEFVLMAEDLVRWLSGMKYLSKIDLTKGYWQIPVAPEDVYRTTFVILGNKSFCGFHLEW